MRFAVVTVVVLLSSTAAAQNHEPKNNEATEASRITLGGHRFMYPALIDTAFIATSIENRTSARYASTRDVPIGNHLTDITSLGVRETLGLEIAFGDIWELGVTALGQFVAGDTGRALATQGAFYAYGAALDGAIRIVRIESSGTQLALRAQAFGVESGGQISLLPFIAAVRNQPLALPDIIANFGDLLVTPTSWWGFAGSVNLAQAITPIFSIQASFRLDFHRVTQSPYVPLSGRNDVTSTSWLPQVGVAVGVNPPGSPIAILAEYRASAQDSADPASFAHNVLALGAYYSGRPDLQIGPVIAGEFGLPPLSGIDANGNPEPGQRGDAITGQIMMRYIW
jgi:hypothetical protein